MIEAKLKNRQFNELIKIIESQGKKIKELETALKVIYTWSKTDNPEFETREKAMKDICNIARKGLEVE